MKCPPESTQAQMIFSRRPSAVVNVCERNASSSFHTGWRFCKERTARRVFAIKGKGGAEVPYFGRPSTSNIVKAPLFTVGVDTGKALLYQRLAVKKWGPNFCHFPAEEGRGYTEEYFRGLTAEKMVVTGQPEQRGFCRRASPCSPTVPPDSARIQFAS